MSDEYPNPFEVTDVEVVTADDPKYVDPIVKVGDPVLTTRAVEVEFPWADGDAVVQSMFAAMFLAGGVGLAAPQVGISLRVFVFNTGTASGVMVNPTLTPDKSAGRSKANEGCLSVPRLFTSKERWNRVDVDGFNTDGTPVSWTAEGLEARVMQHEVDHLNGRLCFQRGR